MSSRLTSSTISSRIRASRRRGRPSPARTARSVTAHGESGNASSPKTTPKSARAGESGSRRRRKLRPRAGSSESQPNTPVRKASAKRGSPASSLSRPAASASAGSTPLTPSSGKRDFRSTFGIRSPSTGVSGGSEHHGIRSNLTRLMDLLSEVERLQAANVALKAEADRVVEMEKALDKSGEDLRDLRLQLRDSEVRHRAALEEAVISSRRLRGELEEAGERGKRKEEEMKLLREDLKEAREENHGLRATLVRERRDREVEEKRLMRRLRRLHAALQERTDVVVGSGGLGVGFRGIDSPVPDEGGLQGLAVGEEDNTTPDDAAGFV